jgi:hypothetical protein
MEIIYQPGFNKDFSMLKPHTMTVRVYVTIVVAYYSINLELVVKLSFFKYDDYMRTHLIFLYFNTTVHNHPPSDNTQNKKNLYWSLHEGLVHAVKFYT